MWTFGEPNQNLSRAEAMEDPKDADSRRELLKMVWSMKEN